MGGFALDYLMRPLSHNIWNHLHGTCTYYMKKKIHRPCESIPFFSGFRGLVLKSGEQVAVCLIANT